MGREQEGNPLLEERNAVSQRVEVIFRLRNLEKGLDRGREKSKVTKPDPGRTDAGEKSI